MHCTCILQSIVTNNHCIGMAKTSIYNITGMTDEIAAEIANLFAKPSTDASIIFAWNYPEIDVFINSMQQYAGQYQPLFDINGIQNARDFALKFLSHSRIIVSSMYLFSEILYACCVLILIEYTHSLFYIHNFENNNDWFLDVNRLNPCFPLCTLFTLNPVDGINDMTNVAFIVPRNPVPFL